jgi:RNA polymerase sigma-70 factor (ECF subfamily)
LLEALAQVLRAFVRGALARYGAGVEEAEDVVQETLLAVHLKRDTWDEQKPLLPWVQAIARNKLVDSLRVDEDRTGPQGLVPQSRSGRSRPARG